MILNLRTTKYVIGNFINNLFNIVFYFIETMMFYSVMQTQDNNEKWTYWYFIGSSTAGDVMIVGAVFLLNSVVLLFLGITPSSLRSMHTMVTTSYWNSKGQHHILPGFLSIILSKRRAYHNKIEMSRWSCVRLLCTMT